MTPNRCARPRHRRLIAQTMALVALCLPLLLAVSMLVVELGASYADRRAVQSGADSGALAGAGMLSNSTQSLLQTAQAYAWRGLNQPVPAAATQASTCSSWAASPCTVTDSVYPQTGGYQVTVTTPYTTADPVYTPSEVVAVDIVHVKPEVGLATMFGFRSTRVSAHAAATASAGVTGFPFALATRFLDLTGNGAVGVFGAALVSACSGDGAGAFTDHNQNGGIYFGGSGSELDLAAAADSPSQSAPPPYSSAVVTLLADPATARCTQTSGDASAGWGTFGDKVSFTAGAPEYNVAYGFNAGPPGCAIGVSAPCLQTSTGDGTWEDPCWMQNSVAAPIKVASGVYNVGLASPGTPNLGSVTACVRPQESHEGSFAYSAWTGFPVYPAPATVAAREGIAFSGSARTLSSTTVSSDQYFTSVSVAQSAQLRFADGWYVFDGPSASVNLKSGSLTCTGSSPTSTIPGCVFVFENGASLSVQQGLVACNGSVAGEGNCSFQFSSTSATGAVGTLSFTNGTNVALHPILTPSWHLSVATPVVWTMNSTNCLGGSGTCAVAMQQSGATFDVLGTFYAPHGVAYFNANAAAVSGQIIADTIRLQAGASAAASGVAYNGHAVAPPAVNPTLVE